MDDNKIVELYWNRDEAAIPATQKKYGAYCTAIAGNILSSREDVEECVNDTYLSAWNSMPPHKPSVLAAFLGKLTRNLSFNRYKYNTADKRGSGELPAVLEELAELVSGREDVEEQVMRRELVLALNAFLETLPGQKRDIFVRRYWYTDSVADIAKRYGMRADTVSMTLNRLRKKLQTCLSERGFDL